MRSRWRGAWVLAALLALETGCHHQIPRLVARGEYAEAAARAGASRRPPKRKAARAWARALEALGRTDEARAVLLRDFRTTGEVRSMVELAELEAAHGLVGVATVHFERAATLDPDALRGHAEMCGLLRRRARAFGDIGEAIAGDQDMRRVAFLCEPVSDDAALAGRLRAAAEADVKALRTLGPCVEAGGEACRGAPLASEALEVARGRGPVALREATRRLGVEVEAGDVVGFLAAELAGELGVDLVGQDELRAWVGERPIEAFQPVIEAIPSEATQAYVRLRLGRLGAGYSLPVAEGEVGSEAALVTRTLEALDAGGPVKGGLGWRVLAIVGDLPGAEMAVGSALKTQHQALTRGVEWRPAQSRVPVPSHWGAKVVVDSTTLGPLLVLARMRAAAGSEAQGVEIARYALAEAEARGIAGARGMGAREAHHALASGRPWQALAIADAMGGELPVSEAAAASILLARAVCADGCGEAEERAAVERSCGEAWLKEMEGRLAALASARAHPADPAIGGCPSASEALASDGVGALAEALRLAREPGAKGLEAASRAAIEADLTLSCAGRYVAPVMLATGQRVGARAIGESLSQGPQTVAAGILGLEGELALVGELGSQAEARFAAAAGASVDPRAVWRRAAWFAHLADARELELEALREVLLHGARGEEAAAARRGLVLRALRDANDAWALRESAVGRETLARAVQDYVDGVEPAARWRAREGLANALAEETWSDEQAAVLVWDALWPEPELARQHPAASARLEAVLRRSPASLRADPLSASELALAAGDASLARPTSLHFLPAGELAEVALGRARQRPKEPASVRGAIAAAFVGAPSVREVALRVVLDGLRESGESKRRRAVEDLLLAGLPALPAADGEVVPMIEGAEALMVLIYGIDPLRRAREDGAKKGL